MRFTSNIDLSGNRIINQAAGTSPTDAINKQQLDAVTFNSLSKTPVKLATVSNISLSGIQAVDGEIVSNGDRVLVKNQTNAVENGIYNVSTSGAWTRTSDFNIGINVVGASVFVLAGATNAGKLFIMSANNAIIGTSNLTFIRFSDGSTYAAGYGLTVNSGGTFAINRSQIASKFSTLIGDGVNTVLTVTHNLNTQDIIISVRKTSNNEVVLVDWVADTVNTVKITFITPPISGEHRITVIG